jgi:hypothetical protein
MVSSFHTRKMAEWAISEILQKNAVRIRVWTQAGNSADRLPLAGETGRNVGCGLIRKTGQMIELGKVQMFLKKKRYNGMPYYIVTAYLIK